VGSGKENQLQKAAGRLRVVVPAGGSGIETPLLLVLDG